MSKMKVWLLLCIFELESFLSKNQSGYFFNSRWNYIRHLQFPFPKSWLTAVCTSIHYQLSNWVTLSRFLKKGSQNQHKVKISVKMSWQQSWWLEESGLTANWYCWLKSECSIYVFGPIASQCWLAICCCLEGCVKIILNIAILNEHLTL